LIGRSDPWFLGEKKPLHRRPKPLFLVIVIALVVGLIILGAAGHTSPQQSQLMPGSAISPMQQQWCSGNPGTVSFYADSHNESYSLASETDSNYVAACLGAYSQSNP
jgi:hypothetical protein